MARRKLRGTTDATAVSSHQDVSTGPARRTHAGRAGPGPRRSTADGLRSTPYICPDLLEHRQHTASTQGVGTLTAVGASKAIRAASRPWERARLKKHMAAAPSAAVGEVGKHEYVRARPGG